MIAPIVQVSAVNFSFGALELRKQILFDIDLEIYPGEIVILEGPSGSGKTTLLTLISGLRTFHEDRSSFLGQRFATLLNRIW